MISPKTNLPSSETPEHDMHMVQSVAEIVSAYVANNKVEAAQIPQIIDSVHQALAGTRRQTPEVPKPAVAVTKSVTPNEIFCLECGKGFKSIKRHIRAAHNMTPEDYRRKWNLAGDHPMVAPNYAVERSRLAKSLGLGTQPKQRGRTSSQA